MSHRAAPQFRNPMTNPGTHQAHPNRPTLRLNGVDVRTGTPSDALRAQRPVRCWCGYPGGGHRGYVRAPSPMEPPSCISSASTKTAAREHRHRRPHVTTQQINPRHLYQVASQPTGPHNAQLSGVCELVTAGRDFTPCVSAPRQTRPMSPVCRSRYGENRIKRVLCSVVRGQPVSILQ